MCTQVNGIVPKCEFVVLECYRQSYIKKVLSQKNLSNLIKLTIYLYIRFKLNLQNHQTGRARQV